MSGGEGGGRGGEGGRWEVLERPGVWRLVWSGRCPSGSVVSH
ncbi:hypothetical protein E2C01_081451 [Portunus trituberculatus]|uniref:Uncharacterized protein n=1 Tax=Portunus trituberculatus TaxID=210409 RepID=A0A5B7IY85_PORTR|nr:hypothetical protein [Portunus trituberculatus]